MQKSDTTAVEGKMIQFLQNIIEEVYAGVYLVIVYNVINISFCKDMYAKIKLSQIWHK